MSQQYGSARGGIRMGRQRRLLLLSEHPSPSFAFHGSSDASTPIGGACRMLNPGHTLEFAAESPRWSPGIVWPLGLLPPSPERHTTRGKTQRTTTRETTRKEWSWSSAKGMGPHRRRRRRRRKKEPLVGLVPMPVGGRGVWYTTARACRRSWRRRRGWWGG